MTNNSRNDSDSNTPAVLDRNIAIYELYRVWKSLPVIVLNKLNRDQYLEQIGIDDPVIMDLCKIRTQKDFAEQYDIDEDTLTRWNKDLRNRDPLFEAKGWAQALAKNMVMALYMHAIKKGDAQLIKLYFQVVNDWNEKSTVEHTIPQITEFNVILNKPKDESNIIKTTTDSTTNKDKPESDNKTVNRLGVPNRL